MIELPDWAVPNGMTQGYVDFGGFLTPPLGAKVQRIDRMGNRFRLAFTFPVFKAKDQGRIIVSRLIRGKSEGLRLALPLADFDPGAPGAPVVDGAGQAGRSLLVRGFTPHYAAKEGQWFSHARADGSCLYNMDGQSIADAAGGATIGFSPMLRVEPADGDVLNFARPTIEGYVQGDEQSWQISVDRFLSIEFQIEEME